jgi:hypothetical protein
MDLFASSDVKVQNVANISQLDPLGRVNPNYWTKLST